MFARGDNGAERPKDDCAVDAFTAVAALRAVSQEMPQVVIFKHVARIGGNIS
jgi:hypothetical protein